MLGSPTQMTVMLVTLRVKNQRARHSRPGRTGSSRAQSRKRTAPFRAAEKSQSPLSPIRARARIPSPSIIPPPVPPG